MTRIIEICADSAQSCAEAEAGGAQRAELCANFLEGGITPSYGEIRAAQTFASTIRLVVLIRPRGGDFVYSPPEIDAILHDIELCKQLHVYGIAIGCLTSRHTIDTRQLQQFVAAARPLAVTFHRAFDLVNDPQRALEQIIDCGCQRILTSGQQPSAEQGIPLIAELVRQADNRITIMPGGGIRPHNIDRIQAATHATEFHASARRSRTPSVQQRKANIFNHPALRLLPRQQTHRTHRTLVAPLLPNP